MENDSQKIVSPVCLVCQTVYTHFFCKKNGCNLYRCSDCGLLFVWPLSTDYSNIYSKDYFSGAQQGFGYADYDADKEPMAGTFNQYIDIINRCGKTTGRLLDVGAATGYFLNIALQRGWQARGVEISEHAVSTGRERGLNLAVGTLEAVHFEPASFDVVTLWDIIEHVPNPVVELQQVYRVLKSGGIIAINTPDASSLFARLMGKRWHLLVPPEHLVYFSSHNLKQLLEHSGFKVRVINKIGKRFSLQYIFKTLAHWQNFCVWKFLAQKLRDTRVGRISVPVNLRDNFLIVAQKI